MTTVIAKRTVVRVHPGDVIFFWPDFGRPRSVRYNDEKFTVTRTRTGALGSGIYYEIMDSKGHKARWWHKSRFREVEEQP